MIYKALAASIIKCLTQILEEDDLSADSRESLEVSIQCLGSAYGVSDSDALKNFDILELFKKTQPEPVKVEVTPEMKAEAEKLKNEGNSLTKADKLDEALLKYTKAIELDGKNPVFYCNRAAVYSKLGNHQQAIKDCNAALSIDSSYCKAYSRLGLAYSSLNRFKEAKECYEKALELDPDNESLKNNLLIAEESLSRQSSEGVGAAAGFSNINLQSFLSNPTFINMATQMLANPAMQNMMSSFMSGSGNEGGGNMDQMSALIEAGQRLAEQMHTSNPELIDSLRRQTRGDPNDQDSSENK